MAEGTVELEIKPQYLNMKKQFEGKMHIIEIAEQSMKDLGITPVVKTIRGGTDGSNFLIWGCLVLNIFTGGPFHGPYEYVPLESMEKATQVIIHTPYRGVFIKLVLIYSLYIYDFCFWYGGILRCQLD